MAVRSLGPIVFLCGEGGMLDEWRRQGRQREWKRGGVEEVKREMSAPSCIGGEEDGRGIDRGGCDGAVGLNKCSCFLLLTTVC